MTAFACAAVRIYCYFEATIEYVRAFFNPIYTTPDKAVLQVRFSESLRKTSENLSHVSPASFAPRRNCFSDSL